MWSDLLVEIRGHIYSPGREIGSGKTERESLEMRNLECSDSQRQTWL